MNSASLRRLPLRPAALVAVLLLGLSTPAFAGSPAALVAASRHPTLFSDVAERAVRSVVNVAVRSHVHPAARRGPSSPFERGQRFRPGPSPRGPSERGSLGSGVIVDAKGIVLTNNHVVRNAKTIEVTLHDGRKLAATLIGADPQSDVAVLQLEGDLRGLVPMAFADSDKARLGQVVLAIGSPFGLTQTVTAGIVSAKGRTNVGIVDYEDFIQTDAAINPGNSGGALVDLQGHLLGINTAIASRTGGSNGIGFAIPSAMAQRVMGGLMRDGKVDRGWLGIAIQEVDRRLAQAFGLGDRRGVLIADVRPGSPAERSGLKRGDVIMAVDDLSVQQPSRLRNAIAAKGSQHQVNLHIWREAKAVVVSVKLGRAPSQAVAIARAPKAQPHGRWGLAVAALDSVTRQRFHLPPGFDSRRANTPTGHRAGVVVVDVQPGSPAAKAGLQPGAVIVAVGQQGVSSPANFMSRVRSLGAAKRLLLRVVTPAGVRFVVLER